MTQAVIRWSDHRCAEAGTMSQRTPRFRLRNLCQLGDAILPSLFLFTWYLLPFPSDSLKAFLKATLKHHLFLEALLSACE